MSANWHPAVAAAQGQAERLLRPHQVAKILGVTSRQVRRLCQLGKLASERTSERNLKIPESALREYLEAINQEG